MTTEDNSGAEFEATVEGLRKRDVLGGENPEETFTVKISVHESDPLDSLWGKVYDRGFFKPDSFECSDTEHFFGSKKSVMLPYEEVIVVADNQPSAKNQIRLNETLIVHNNAHYGKPIEFNIAEIDSSYTKNPNKFIETNNGLRMSFERTIRMPDDNKLHQIPGSLGSYDLFNASAYSDRLPDNIREAGGVFLAMWQREAMWINFDKTTHWGPAHAVRVFIGKINAVSGMRMDEESTKNDNAPGQDYVVIPGQEWLDGICVAPGVVRQFVAMPLGSGYTVEDQKTSEEKHGGLQIEIIPQFEERLRWWVPQGKGHIRSEENESEIPIMNQGLNEMDSAAQMGLKIGDVLLSYPPKASEYEPFKIKDIVSEKNGLACQARYTYPSSPWSAVKFGASGPPPIQGRSKMNHSIVSSYSDFTECRALEPPIPEQQDNNDTDITTRDDVIENEIDIKDTTDLKAMGLAAGGKLVQDIYKDRLPANMWNHAAARIINIHILDPESCEKVTHIVPLPPPISVDEYVEDGGQFFVVEEKVDDRVEGGDFDNVKSVSQMDKHIGVTTEPEFDPTKPKMCTGCEIRLCDCIVRPCDHQFCNICIKKLEKEGESDPVLARKNWKCPTCNKGVQRVAGFSAPMNLPGEEAVKVKVPVNVLKIEDGRIKFSSVQKTRI